MDVETNIISGITNFAPGYIDKENEIIVGLQTDAPLKRIVNYTAAREWPILLWNSTDTN